MLKRIRQALKLSKSSLIKGLGWTAAVVGFLYLYGRVQDLSRPQADIVSDTEIEIQFVDDSDAKPDFKEFCLRSGNNLCQNNQLTTDFLYNDGEEIAVIKAEEFNPERLEAAMSPEKEKLRQLAKLIEQDISLDVRPQDENLFRHLEIFTQNILDRLYEEELPDDIIDAENGDNTNVHIYDKKAADLNIIPEAKPFYLGELPLIAIVIDDMGISQRRTRDIAEIKAPLTASFLTYGQNLQKQIENSRQAGHEIMIHVPMEAQRNTDAAPDVLTTQMSEDEIKQNLKKMLEKFDGVKGINNHMGSKLTEDEDRMKAVMEVLAENHLFFLDSKTSARSKAETAAKKIRIAYAHRHVFLDNENNKDYILGQLAKTENLARKNGYAIAIGHPKSETYAALQTWVATLEDKKLHLVHLSSLIEKLNPHKELTALHLPSEALSASKTQITEK